MKPFKNKKTRYFFVCTTGKSENGISSLSTFDMKTDGEYPTIRQCIETSNKRIPLLNDVMLVSITEISHNDWMVFLSEQ